MLNYVLNLLRQVSYSAVYGHPTGSHIQQSLIFHFFTSFCTTKCSTKGILYHWNLRRSLKVSSDTRLIPPLNSTWSKKCPRFWCYFWSPQLCVTFVSNCSSLYKNLEQICDASVIAKVFQTWSTSIHLTVEKEAGEICRFRTGRFLNGAVYRMTT